MASFDLGGSFATYNDPQGNALIALNRDGSILSQTTRFPDGTQYGQMTVTLSSAQIKAGPQQILAGVPGKTIVPIGDFFAHYRFGTVPYALQGSVNQPGLQFLWGAPDNGTTIDQDQTMTFGNVIQITASTDQISFIGSGGSTAHPLASSNALVGQPMYVIISDSNFSQIFPAINGDGTIEISFSYRLI